MANTRLGILIAAITALSSSWGVGCGARVDEGAVTETGNPSFIKDTRITATPLDGVIVVEGDAGAVPGGAQVTIRNESSSEISSAAANEDGSFELSVANDQGDTLELTVESNGRTETKRIEVADAPPTTEPPSSSGDVSSAPPRVPAVHRAEAEACDEERPPGSFEDGEQESFDPSVCSKDADCTEGVRGRCMGGRGVMCTYDECTLDSECSTGGPCQCANANTCLQGNCQVDDDCGGGGYCSPSMGTCGSYSGIIGYWCHTPADECVDDADCAAADMGPGYCMFSPEAAHWLCSYTTCVG